MGCEAINIRTGLYEHTKTRKRSQVEAQSFRLSPRGFLGRLSLRILNDLLSDGGGCGSGSGLGFLLPFHGLFQLRPPLSESHDHLFLGGVRTRLRIYQVKGRTWDSFSALRALTSSSSSLILLFNWASRSLVALVVIDREPKSGGANCRGGCPATEAVITRWAYRSREDLLRESTQMGRTSLRAWRILSLRALSLSCRILRTAFISPNWFCNVETSAFRATFSFLSLPFSSPGGMTKNDSARSSSGNSGSDHMDTTHLDDRPSSARTSSRSSCRLFGVVWAL